MGGITISSAFFSLLKLQCLVTETSGLQRACKTDKIEGSHPPNMYPTPVGSILGEKESCHYVSLLRTGGRAARGRRGRVGAGGLDTLTVEARR